MRKATRAALAATAIALLAVGGSTAASAAPAIPLTTGQETLIVTGGAHGSFSYTIEGDQFCYTLSAQRLSTPAMAAHVHAAPRGVDGAVVIPLAVLGQTSFETSECKTVDTTLLAAISANPGDYYVNVHTSMHTPGEVRGQLK